MPRFWTSSRAYQEKKPNTKLPLLRLSFVSNYHFEENPCSRKLLSSSKRCSHQHMVSGAIDKTVRLFKATTTSQQRNKAIHLLYLEHVEWRKLHTNLSKYHLQEGVNLAKPQCGHLFDHTQAMTHNSKPKYSTCSLLLSFTTRYCHEVKDKTM